jgi:peptide alpha-N-acetyltransferase
VWCRHYLAQHYDHLGQHAKALELIQAALDHTPTVLELYMVQAKIYKVGLQSFKMTKA